MINYSSLREANPRKRGSADDNDKGTSPRHTVRYDRARHDTTSPVSSSFSLSHFACDVAFRPIVVKLSEQRECVIHIHVHHRTHHSDWAERLARGSARPYAPASQGFFGSFCLLSRLPFRLPGTDDPAWPVSVVRDLSRACLYASATLV